MILPKSGKQPTTQRQQHLAVKIKWRGLNQGDNKCANMDTKRLAPEDNPLQVKNTDLAEDIINIINTKNVTKDKLESLLENMNHASQNILKCV